MRTSTSRAVSSLLFLLLLCSTLLLCVDARSSNQQQSSNEHPHSGKLTPFTPGDPKLKLTKAALKLLKQGKPYQTQSTKDSSGSGGRGVVVQDIHAPVDIVWKTLLSFDTYSDMVPKTTFSKNYKIVENSNKQQIIYTKMIAGFPFYKLTWYIRHSYYPKLQSLTWTLDYTKKSDLDDSVGYWYVIQHPDNMHHTRVYYSCSILLYSYIPTFIINFMTKQALKDATSWVKKYSELEYSKVGGAEVQVATTKKKKRGFFFGWFQKNDDRDDDDEQGEMSATTATQTATERKLPSKDSSLGLARYALLTYVFSLGVYNVHVYLSQ